MEMIRRKVSAVLLVRDGFTGRAMASGSALLCRLDGQMVRPLFKDGGWLVLMDLEPGEHTLVLSCQGFQTETVPLHIADGPFPQLEISLRPGPRYAFPPDTARLRLELREGDGVLGEELFWIGWTAPVQLRLSREIQPSDGAAEKPAASGDGAPDKTAPSGAADEAAPDGASVRLFCSGPVSFLPVPGHFLLLDDDQPELVHIRGLRDGSGTLDGPPRFAHPRGTRLVPAAPFRTDGEGRAAASFPQGGAVSLFCRERRRDVDLRAGTLDYTWNLSE